MIVYDSAYGNTEQIARAIASALGPSEDVRLVRVSDVIPEQLHGAELVIVGSPTQGGRPTTAVQDFLKTISEPAIKGISIVAFDTRFSTRWVKIFGYAAGKIARSLQKLGGILIVSPEGFFVEGTKGPLKEGELERAASWAKGFAK